MGVFSGLKIRKENKTTVVLLKNILQINFLLIKGLMRLKLLQTLSNLLKQITRFNINTYVLMHDEKLNNYFN